MQQKEENRTMESRERTEVFKKRENEKNKKTELEF